MKKILGLPGLIVINLLSLVVALVVVAVLLSEISIPVLTESLPRFVSEGIELPELVAKFVPEGTVEDLAGNATDYIIEGVAKPAVEKMQFIALIVAGGLIFLSPVTGKRTMTGALILGAGIVVFGLLGLGVLQPEQLAALVR
jgi:hypothetical protein